MRSHYNITAISWTDEKKPSPLTRPVFKQVPLEQILNAGVTPPCTITDQVSAE